jgi:hypothetical protein
MRAAVLHLYGTRLRFCQKCVPPPRAAAAAAAARRAARAAAAFGRFVCRFC